ncbi:MAG TPA: hypothetical protein VL988_06075 [Solirubrobacteraceae bacterium]|nr:hypothetical protein [Solirubrobacteraceae bacterium]
MNRYRHHIAALLACALTLGVLGCGGSSDVVHFEGLPNASISTATLSHWMQAMAGGGFRQIIGTRGPTGLASEPADYKRCVRAAKLVAPKTFFGQQKLSDADLNTKCHRLHEALKAQALNFLIAVQWTIAEGERHGIKITEADLRRQFAKQRKYQYPTEADLRKYLSERQWTLADVFYQLKRNMIVSRLAPLVQQQITAAGGGERANVEVAMTRQKSRSSKTICKPGFVVSNCKEYRPGAPELSSSVIFEEIAEGKKG